MSRKHKAVKSKKPIRGAGSFGWGEGNKVLSTLKKIEAATFIEGDSDEVEDEGWVEDKKFPILKPRIRKTCPKCGRRITVKNGKFVQHGTS